MACNLQGMNDPIELLDVVTGVVRILQRAAAQPDDTGEGLSLTEFRVLKRVSAGMKRVRDLATDLDVTVPTISAAVDSLVRRDYIRRCAPVGDRRSVPLAVTNEGQRALGAARDRQYQGIQNLLARLNSDEQQALATATSALTKALSRR